MQLSPLAYNPLAEYKNFCKFCNHQNLKWVLTNKWNLTHPDGSIHKCRL